MNVSNQFHHSKDQFWVFVNYFKYLNINCYLFPYTHIYLDTIFNQRGVLPPQVMGTSMAHSNIPYQQQRLNQNPSRYQNVQQNSRQRAVMKQSSGGQLEVAGAVVGIWGANYSMSAAGNPYMGRGNMIPPQNVKFNNYK